eukprot:m.249437 g.249437  ORF g.249437 m.249437 type:complete len:4140 (-) comp33873_c0_seq1:75-12494(-)
MAVLRQKLDQLLLNLNLTLASDSPQRNYTAEQLAKDLQGMVLEDQTSGLLSQSYIASRVFGDERGILTYLQKSPPDTHSFTKSKRILLETLAAFIERHGASILSYVKHIAAVCKKTSFDGASEVKLASAEPLFKLINLGGTLDSDARKTLAKDMDIEEIADRYLQDLYASKSKVRAKAMGLAFNLLGTLSEQYPDTMTRYHASAMKVGVDQLSNQIKDATTIDRTGNPKGMEQALVTGVINGISGWMTHFNPECTCKKAPTKKCEMCEIFKSALTIIKPENVMRMSRFDVAHAALRLFNKHAAQFSGQFRKYYEKLLDYLLRNVEHTNKEFCSEVYVVLDAFVREIADCLSAEIGDTAMQVDSGAKTVSSAKAAFTFLLIQFKSVLQEPSSTKRKASMALRGMGYLAGPCSKQESAADVQRLFEFVAERCERLCGGDFVDSPEAHEFLPVYLETISHMTQYLTRPSEQFLSVLNRVAMLIATIINKVVLSRFKKFINSFVITFRNLSNRDYYLRAVIQTTAKQALFSMCTRQLSVDKEDADTLDRKRHGEFFTLLLTHKSLDASIQTTIYDVFVGEIMALVGHLDIGIADGEDDEDQRNVVDASDEQQQHDEVDALDRGRPSSRQDYQAFHILAEFCAEMLSKTRTDLFERWAASLIQSIIKLAKKTQNRQVPGVYNLLQSFLLISNERGLLSNVTLVGHGNGGGDDVMMEMDQLSGDEDDDEFTADANANSELQACCAMLKRFALETQDWSQHFKDELLAAAVSFILSVPPEIITDELALFVPALRTSLKMGASFAPLAHVGFDALETWLEKVPRVLIEPHLQRILPLVAPFLTPVVHENNSADNIEAQHKKMKQRVVKKRKKRNAIDGGDTVDELEQPLSARAMSLLGNLGGEYSMKIAEAEQRSTERPPWIAWASTKCLRYEFPHLPSCQPIGVYLDDALPALIDSATKASVRAQKLAACEALHSVATLLIGETKQQSGNGGIQTLWDNVFPALLKLACDVERTVMKLFQPLVLQIVRWIAGLHGDAPEFQKNILDCVFATVVDTESCQLREVSSKCIAEFFKWSVKQASDAQIEGDKVLGIREMLRRVYELAIHPGPYHRLGAAKIVNLMVRTFQAHPVLVDKYGLELLVHMVDSLKYERYKQASDSTAEQGILAASRVLRAISKSERLQYLVFATESRAVPPLWTTESTHLAKLVEWAFGLLSRKQPGVRKVCWDVIHRLASKSSSPDATSSSCKAWMQRKLKEHGRSLFERDLHSLTPLTNEMAKTLDESKAKTEVWLDDLAIALNNYVMILKRDYLPAEAIMDGSDSPLFQHMRRFARHLCEKKWKSYQQAGDEMGTVILKTLGLFLDMCFQCLKRPKCELLVPKGFWTDKNVVTCVALATLSPLDLGLDSMSTYVDLEINKRVGQILAVKNSAIQKGLVKVISKHVARHTLAADIHEAVRGTAVHHLRLRLQIKGYLLLHAFRPADERGSPTYLDHALKGLGEKVESMCTDILDCLSQACRRAWGLPQQTELYVEIMSLAMVLRVSSKRLFECLTDDIAVGGEHDTVSVTKGGEYFYTHFAELVCGFMARHHKKFVPELFARAENPVVMQALHGTLEYAVSANVDVAEQNKVLATVLECVGNEELVPNAVYQTDTERLLDTIAILQKVFALTERMRDSDLYTVIESENFQRILKMYFEVLRGTDTDTKLTLTQKLGAIQCLTYIGKFKRVAGEIAGLSEAIKSLVTIDFDHTITKSAGEIAMQEYTVGLDCLLNAMVVSGLWEVLHHVAVRVMCLGSLRGEETHSHEYQIRQALFKFMENSHTDVQDVLNRVFRLFSNAQADPNESYPVELTLALVKRVLCAFLMKVSEADVEAFFMKNIISILSIVTEKGTSEEMKSNALMCRHIGGFALLQVMFARLPSEKVKGSESSIEEAYCKHKKKEFIEDSKELLKFLCHKDSLPKYINHLFNTNDADRALEYRVASYGALAELLKCTQSRDGLAKFSKKFLMVPSEKSENYLGRFVKGDERYEFGRLYEQVVLKIESTDDLHKSEVGLLRSSYKSKLFYLDVPDENSEAVNETSVVELFETMLSESKESNWDGEPQRNTLVSWIDRLSIKVDNKPIKASAEAPEWMASLLGHFRIAGDNRNVQILVLKLILARPDEFAPWAKLWFGPMLMVLRRYFESSDAGFDSLVLECCLLFISKWEGVPDDDDAKPHAIKFLGALMENANSNLMPIMKNNTVIIFMLLKKWKAIADTNDIAFLSSVVFAKLSSKNKTLCGLYLLEGMLAAEVLPWNDSDESALAQYFGCLLSRIAGTKELTSTIDGYSDKDYMTSVSLNAAKCLGSIQLPDEQQDQIEQSVAKALKAKEHTSDPTGFLVCVYKLSVNGTLFYSERSVSTVEDMLSKLAPKQKLLALRIMILCASEVPDILKSIQKENFKGMMTHDDPASQGASLEILHNNMPHIDLDEYTSWILEATSAAFVSHSSAAHRLAYYRYLCALRTHLGITPTANITSKSKSKKKKAETATWSLASLPAEVQVVVRAVEVHLISGFSDGSGKVRDECLDYWDKYGGLGDDYVARMQFAMQHMYTQSTEPGFLQVVANLTVRSSHHGNASSTTLFDTALADGQWRDMALEYGDMATHHNVHMSSLYAESQRNHNIGGNANIGDGGFVRATQTQESLGSQFTQLTQFTQTMSYGVQTQSSDNTDEVDLPSSQGDQAEASQMVHDAELRYTRMQLLQPKKAKKAPPKPYSQYYIDGLARRRMEQNDKKKKQRLQRAWGSRTYREGDLPYVQIKHADLLKPIQGLILEDAEFGHQMYSLLFESVYAVAAHAGVDLDPLHACFSHLFQPNPHNPSNRFVAAICGACANIEELTIDLGVVRRRTLETSAFQAGILLMEKQVTNMAVEENDEPPANKRQRTSALTRTPQEGVTTAWRELAHLYKAVGDYDALNSIYRRAGLWDDDLYNGMQEALDHEAANDFEKAKTHYEKLQSIATADHGEGVNNFLEGAIYKCNLELCLWNEAATSKHLTSEGAEDSESDRLGLLSQQITCQLQSYLQNEHSDGGSLATIIQQSVTNPESRAAVEEALSLELASYYACRATREPGETGNVDLARSFFHVSAEAWLRKWASLHPLMEVARMSAVRQIQRIVELDERLNFSEKTTVVDQNQYAQQVLNRWQQRPPASILDPMPHWDFSSSSRDVTLSLIEDTCRNVLKDKNLANSARRDRVTNAVVCAAHATLSKAFDVGGQWLKKCRSMIGENDKVGGSFQYNHGKATRELASLHRRNDVSKQVGALCKTLGQMLRGYDDDKTKKSWISQNPLARCQHRMLKYEFTRALGSELTQAGDELYNTFRADKSIDIGRALGLEKAPRSLHDATNVALQRSYDALIDAAKGLSNSSPAPNDRDAFQQEHARAQILLAKFAHEHLKDGSLSISETNLQQTAILSTLAGMSHGSKEASYLFARVLRMMETIDDKALVDMFKRETASLPSWMFIRWISQLIPLLGKDCWELVHHILKKIAQDYPGSLAYPLMISAPQLQLASGSRVNDALRKLQAQVTPTSLSEFVSQLEYLHHPHLAFGDWVDSVIDGTPVTPESLKNIIDRLAVDKSVRREKGTGIVRKTFGDAFSKQLEKLFSRVRPGSKIDKDWKADARALKAETNEWFTKNHKRALFSQGPGKRLRDYSSWLHGYQANNHEIKIEVPGQYAIDTKPRPELHAYIDNFEDNLMVLQSMRIPKRIVFRASDSSIKKFLVKGGEDLRLDQRVQQVFELMNGVFASENECRKRKLNLRTYQVYPMTARIGLIDWVDNTKVLKEMIDSQASKQQAITTGGAAAGGRGRAKAKPTAAQTPADCYRKWVDSCGGYPEMFGKDEKAVLKNWAEVTRIAGSQLHLRNSMLKMASCPQAHVMLRSSFGRSLATLSICQYIMGIGDRHRSNCMIDIHTGELVGIDFGHAFDSATVLLPVPELMPFRLTRQLLGMFHPHGCDGWFKLAMQHALDALRVHQDGLLATLEVFVDEPLLDWVQHANKKTKQSGRGGSQSKSQKESQEKSQDRFGAEQVKAYSLAKLEHVKDKLNLVNPAVITNANLELNPRAKKNIEKLRLIVKPKSNSIRGSAGRTCSNTKHQVECLIEMATDPNVIGRSWIGWEPWN